MIGAKGTPATPRRFKNHEGLMSNRPTLTEVP
jgi:hypothetical protein